MNNEPVAWLLFRDGGESYPEYTNSYKQMREWETYLGDNERIEPHYTHPAKTQSNLVNVVKNHIKDLQNCVKLFRSAEMDNTANEMEVAIKELEDALYTHPAKTLTDEEIGQIFADNLIFMIRTKEDADNLIECAKAILRKASEK